MSKRQNRRRKDECAYFDLLNHNVHCRLDVTDSGGRYILIIGGSNRYESKGAMFILGRKATRQLARLLACKLIGY